MFGDVGRAAGLEAAALGKGGGMVEELVDGKCRRCHFCEGGDFGRYAWFSMDNMFIYFGGFERTGY